MAASQFLQGGKVASPVAAETEVASDMDLPYLQSAQQNPAHERFRGQRRQFTGERHLHNEIDAGLLQPVHLLSAGGDEARCRIGVQDLLRVWIEGDQDHRAAMGAGPLTQRGQNALMADVDAVEVAHSGHGVGQMRLGILRRENDLHAIQPANHALPVSSSGRVSQRMIQL